MCSIATIGGPERQKCDRKDKATFEGVCLDTGDQNSVIGEKQARAYCRQLSCKYELNRSSTTVLRFGDGSSTSKGTIRLRIPTPNESYVHLDADVIRFDIPFLLGLDIMDREGLLPNNVLNRLQTYHGNWYIPIVRKFGHLYICWNNATTLFTRNELLKLHRHFQHPLIGKLFALIKRARPEQSNESTRKMLDEIRKSCETCQVYSAPPQRFTVTLPPDNLTFNR